MPIYELDLKNIGPYDDIHFEFDPHINVFVGPNNCGKSTVQMALGDIAVYPFALPEKLLRNEQAKFQVCKGPTFQKRKYFKGILPIGNRNTWKKTDIDNYLKTLIDIGYTCFIPALRWSTDFRAESAGKRAERIRKESSKPMRYVLKEDLEAHKREERKRLGTKVEKDLTKRKALFEWNESVVRDEVLVQRIIDMDYRAYREKNHYIRKIIERIAEIASEVTDGFPLEFLGVKEDKEGLYPEFKTRDGKLPLNCLSQGTQSIIQWVGLILIGYAEYYNFPKNLESKRGVVIIDEIDAHLHPSWQRRILPALSRNFPNLQIFCSAHSPMVLAGLKAGQAHLLKRNNKGKVVVSRNETDIVGWSTDEILRNFLDITNTTDLRTSENIEKLQILRNKRRLTQKQKKQLEVLRKTVNQDLLSGPVSGEIIDLAAKLRKPSKEKPRVTKKIKKIKKVKIKKVKKIAASRKSAVRVKSKGAKS